MAAWSAFRPLRLAARPSRRIASVQELFVRNIKSHTGDSNHQTGAAFPENLKSMEQLPGPSLLNTLYWLFVKGYAEKSHALQVEHKRLYGPIWRSRFGPFDIINVATAELISQVIRQEGHYPVRTALPHWKEYRDLRGQAYGLHVETGAKWYRMRSALNPKMLKFQEAFAYAPIIHDVVSDLLQRVERLRLRSQDKCTVCDLASELYKFGFEGISSILFETRLGCLHEEIPTETLRFITAANNMLTLSETVLFFPRWTRKIFPFWKQFIQAWDDLYDVETFTNIQEYKAAVKQHMVGFNQMRWASARNLINSKVKQMEEQAQRGEQLEGMYLTYLLSSNKLSLPEVYITVTELLLGGVDTTSNTMSWTLYHLAHDAEVQNCLYQEVVSVCPDRRLPTTEDLNRMPYLKAVIKETLRLYPVVPGNGRLIVENEVVVGGYWFPKQTQFHLCHYASSHDENEFPEAKAFIPERWLRATASHSHHHPYSSIPFGVGVRACVGRRVAELEMGFALSRLLQHYEVCPVDGSSDIHPKTRTLLIPAKPINLRFVPRSCK